MNVSNCLRPTAALVIGLVGARLSAHAHARGQPAQVESANGASATLGDVLGRAPVWLWVGFERGHVQGIAAERKALALADDLEILAIDAPRFVRGVIRSSLKDDPSPRRYVFWGPPEALTDTLALELETDAAWLIRYDPQRHIGAVAAVPVSQADLARLHEAIP